MSKPELVLVTGAGGFIGSNIACALAHDGVAVVACDTFTHDRAWEYLMPAGLYDFIRPGEIPNWLSTHAGQVTAIVHMGAISSTTETNLNAFITNNIRLTLDLWRYASDHDATFIYASSAATYGDGSHGFVDDASPGALAQLRPLNAYGWSKHVVDRRIIDDALRSRPSPTRWAGLKFFNVYGPHEGHKGSMRSVVHQLYPLAAAGEPVRLFKSDNPAYADGGQLRDFIYVADCCEIVRKMLAAVSLSGLFNVGTGTARSFADLAKAVFRAVDREPEIEYFDMPDALRHRYQYFTEANTSKLREAGFAPKFHDLESGVADYVHSHLVHELRSGQAITGD